MNRLVGFGLLIFLMAAVAWLLLRTSTRPATVNAAAAASLRPSMEEIVAAYRRDTGRTVTVQYGGSEELLAQVRLPAGERNFDLYIPADESYLTDLAPQAIQALGTMKAVVLFRPSKPIESWTDLTATGRRLALAEPTSAAIGKLTKAKLESSGRWLELAVRVVVHTDTVTHSGNAVKLGTVDAAIVWDAVAVGQFPDLPRVSLPELDGITANVVAARLTIGIESEAFWNFLTTDERCREVLKRQGFAEPSR